MFLGPLLQILAQVSMVILEGMGYIGRFLAQVSTFFDELTSKWNNTLGKIFGAIVKGEQEVTKNMEEEMEKRRTIAAGGGMEAVATKEIEIIGGEFY